MMRVDDRRLFLLGLTISLVLTGAVDVSAAGPQRPNVVFFLVDDLGWKDLGCYGSSFHDTPRIDAFARDSVRFTDAYAACHVCSPTRASILTGKYPATLHMTDWLPGRRDFPFQRLLNGQILQALPFSEVTLAEALKRHGYATGHYGKWHLGEDPSGPLNHGFDVQIPRWNKGWPRAGYHAPFNLEGLTDQPGDYLTDRLTDEAIGFIEEHRDEPFFLYLSHYAVHDPIQGPHDLVEKYEARRSSLAPDPHPFVLEANPDDAPRLSEAELARRIGTSPYDGYKVLPQRSVKIKQRQDNPQFAAMVESMDQSFGRVLDKLKAAGLEDRTIVIFFADNGGMSAANFGRPNRVVAAHQLDLAFSTSNLPLRGAKGWLYEGGVRVPLLVKWPGVGQKNVVCAEPVMSIDFYPTILEMIGLPSPAHQHTDGISFARLVNGQEEQLQRDALFWHFPHYSNHGMQSPGGAIRSGKYKLLEYFENQSVQLFDLEADPGERNDLAETHPQVANRLREQLSQWRQDVKAVMMPPNPDYRRTSE